MNQRELQIRPVVIRFELLEHYQELDLNENDLVILIKILYAYESSNEQPSIDVLKKGTTMQSSEVTAIIQKLIQLGLLAMRVEKNNEGKFTEYINLDGFYEQLASIFKQIETSKETTSEEEAFKMVFKKIETAFGRALSPLEIEHLNQWIDVDHYAIELIDAAIDEALAHQKRHSNILIVFYSIGKKIMSQQLKTHNRYGQNLKSNLNNLLKNRTHSEI